MKRQTAIQTQKENIPSQTRGLLPHAAVRAIPDHNIPSNVSAETRFGHNFSQVAVRPSAPIITQDYSNASCSLFPQRYPFGGACHTCPPPIQAKLKVGQPGDKYEKEADQVADQVMRMPEPRPSSSVDNFPPRNSIAPRGGTMQYVCAPCSEEYEELIQAKIAGNVTHEVTPSISSGIKSLQGGGQPLSGPERSFFEPRFEADFSNVRVHNDTRAANVAHLINARALTLGRDVIFGAGQYAPHHTAGRQLLAHELVHVMQQRKNETGQQLMRQACAHDGQRPACGGGPQARWQLVNVATQEVTDIALDRIIVDQGLSRHLGGRWAAQVQTPPNPVKAGEARGFADGMKVTAAGSLRVEVVEIKSRSTAFHGGCAVASREAAGYVTVLRNIAPQVAEISRSGVPRVPGGARLRAEQRASLQAAGIDLSDPRYLLAWRFYNSLRNRLDTSFPTGFTNVDVEVNRDGTPGQDYDAGPPVEVPCQTRGRPGVQIRQLLFQVNGAGGISYGCRNTRCQTGEEERRQPVREPVAVPEEQSVEEPVTDVTVPILVGVGGAAAAVVARRRAARAAARRLAAEAARREAQRRAAQAAWRRAAEATARRRAQQAAARGAGGRLAGRAASRALIYGEVAAAALLVLSGRAEASIGSGPSALEALYESMARNGTPPSPEMRELIESDPMLRQLAQEAATSGDATALQEEATRRMLELMRNNPDQFSPEDLEVLLQVSSATSSGTAAIPETEAELRAAIERARAIQRGEAVAGRGGGPGTGEGGVGSTEAETRGGPAREGGAGRTGAEGEGQTGERYPALSAEGRQQLTTAPEPVRRLFDAMTSGSGRGPRVTYEAVRRFLQSVPANLTAEEVTRLIERIRPVENESLDEILSRLRAAIEQIRSVDEATDQAEGDIGEVPEVTQPEAGGEREGITREEYTRAVISWISSYGQWDGIAVDEIRFIVAGRNQSFWGARLNHDVLDLIVCGKMPLQGSGSIRIVAFTQAVVTGRTPSSVDLELRSAAVFISERGRTIAILPIGQSILNNRLTR